jgi:diguanylate cyclase (GGDEF)-like protein
MRDSQPDSSKFHMDTLHKRELDALVEIGKALTASLDLPEILQIIMDKVSQVLEPEAWSLLMVDDATDELYFEIIVSPAEAELRDVRLKMGEGIAGWVAEHGEPLLIADVTKDARFASDIAAMVKFDTRSIICVPLTCKGKTAGVIELINSLDEATFTETDLSVLSTIADFAAIGIDNARNFARIQQMVITDELTGLYNAGYLLEFLDYEVERARRYHNHVSVIFIDMDYFKDVNDTHGHQVGSLLLTELGNLIRGNIRKSDRAARYGGDEFVIVLPNTPKSGAYILAKTLCDKIRSSCFLTGQDHDIRITASLGIACYPTDADSKTSLVRMADKAMYAAKEANRDTVRTA